ncbi:YfbU family protein [Pantoea sp. Lij88]|uniref:YfbU family protein n=1 Tax=Pantoea sp. Lij88 TaxID=3028622 RepID=UPI0024B9B0FC|nr:YfbU family protein [Pantoea sp. Lij88]WHQ74633.1 YfbU family protein [Pantoea sp. Lij88]
MKYTQAEKLQILLLCDIHEALGIEHSYDPELIREAVTTDNLWSLEWEYSNLSTQEDNPAEVKHVCDVLDMYNMLKFTYDHLSSNDQTKLAEEVPHFSPEHSLTFPGFDGNNEGRLMGVARILNRMGRFNTQEITKNSHHPTYETSERMLGVYLPERSNFHHQRGITYEALKDTLLARIHPSNR